MTPDNPILALYGKMLATVGMVVDSEGFVSTLTPGADTSKPMFIGERRLVLPYKTQLDQPDWTNRAGFHPLLQNFASGDSVVIDAVRKRGNAFWDFVIGTTVLSLAKLALKQDEHKNLSPEQAKYLRPFSHATDKFVKLLTNIVTAKPAVKKGFEFIRFNVVAGRQWEGKKRSRVAVALFPLYDALPKDGKNCTVAGQNLSIKETKMLVDMFEFLFPHIKEKGFYEVGSDSNFGPSVESLYGLYDILARQQNAHISMLEGAVPGTEYLYIVNDWSDTLKAIPTYAKEIRAIPALEGNDARNRTPVAETKPKEAAAQISTAPMVTVEKSSGVPIITNTQAMNQAIQHQQQQQQERAERPFIQIGISPEEATGFDPRTSLPDNTQVNVARGGGNTGVNVYGFQPTAAPGSLLQEQNEQRVAQQQAVNPFYRAPQQQQQNGPVVSKIPDTAVLINNALYIPLEVEGVGAPPVGSVMYNNRLYVPLNGGGQQQMNGFGQQQSGFMNRGNITDPAQVQGLSEAEIIMYRQNPAMFQQFMAQRSQAGFSQYQQQAQQRTSGTPPYLQRLAEEQQRQQQSNRFGLR